jgi:hypothetical protein
MKYYKNPENNEVYAYEADQQALLDGAIAKGWTDVTGSWPPPTDYKPINKGKSTSLLSATDWVNQPDVIDATKTPHLLNQSAFLSYREALRKIAVNPPETEVTEWPVLPAEQWSA